MSRIDLHPEDLIDLKREGSLTEREAEVLEEHLDHCSSCTLEQALLDDFAAEMEAEPDDEEVVERVLERVIPAQRRLASRRRSYPLAWVAAAATVLLVTVGASATVLAVLSGWIDLRREEAPAPEPAAEPEPSRAAEPRARRPVPAEETAPPTEEPSSEEAVQPPESPVAPASVHDERPRPSTRAAARPPSAGELFAMANEARRDHRNVEAVRLFRELGRAYPGSREEVASRVSLGRVLLDRLNDPRGALRLFESYLGSTPNGTLAQEARVGSALCLRRLGRAEEEARAWQAILDRYPSSIHSRRARQRLEELRRADPPSGLDE